MKSNLTDTINNLDEAKEYYTVSEVKTTLKLGALKTEALNDFPVTDVEPHIDQKKSGCKEWWLCTVPGNVTIAAICAAGIGAIAAAIFVAVKYCKKGKR